MNSVRIGDHCEVTSSKRIYAKEYEEFGIPFFRGKEIVEKYNGQAKITSDLYISESRYNQIKDNFGVPEKGDILLTSVGTIGVPYRVDLDTPFYFKDGNLTWFKNFEGIDSQYLYYWLVSPLGRKELAKCTIGVAQPAYTIVRLKEMRIVLPDETVQKTISKFLKNYDDLIENNKRQIELLEESARQLYKEWFVRFRFPGHEHVKIIDGVPEGWSPKTLSDIVTLVKDTVDPKNIPETTPYIGLEHLPRRSITLNEWENAGKVSSSKFSFKNGDILFGKIRPYFHKVGFTLTDGITSSDAIVLRPKMQNHYCIALLEVSSDAFVALASKTVREGSKMPRADWNVLKSRVVLEPPDAILNVFNNQIEGILNQCKLLSFQNFNLVKARDILLPKLMSGEIAV